MLLKTHALLAMSADLPPDTAFCWLGVYFHLCLKLFQVGDKEERMNVFYFHKHLKITRKVRVKIKKPTGPAG